MDKNLVTSVYASNRTLKVDPRKGRMYGQPCLREKPIQYIIYLMAVVFGFSGHAVSRDVSIHEGVIEKARYAIAIPSCFNGKLFVTAHGERAETITLLDETKSEMIVEEAPLFVNFDLKDEPYASLLQQGWMLATTSYRRNGYIVEEAMMDIENLLDYISKQYGRPRRVIVEGTSMGGEMVVRFAERKDGVHRYDGFVSVGVGIKPNDGFVNIEFKPLRPILFLSNQNELGAPAMYSFRCPENDPYPSQHSSVLML